MLALPEQVTPYLPEELPPEINTSDFTAAPFGTDEAFTGAGNFGS